MSKPQLSQASLERLLIAVIQCETVEGKVLQLDAADVLQDWATEQLPFGSMAQVIHDMINVIP